NPFPGAGFERSSIDAINAALGAGRPLLVRGEPGVGKSQLAEAAARKLKRAFVSKVVDSRTEHRDLMYEFDAVARLAEAQLRHEDPVEARTRLAVRRFVRPGPLWWAFDADGAKRHCEESGVPLASTPLMQPGNKERAANGWVVLIDEIDKAETDVPNGLLEALGLGEFTPPDMDAPVKLSAKIPAPLIIITTNEERILPAAFERRCVALHLALPTQTQKLIDKLIEVGESHFSTGTERRVLNEAAQILADDRAEAEAQRLKPLPGQAEYLDMMRAVIRRSNGNIDKQLSLLANVRKFIVRKAAEMQKGDE
ncbi:MAG TPA: MoxR family ATPase, partial [Planctomycetaceae bacterium]|nr:MoxR family ATPase [Planctomycetaceae bacterium]